MTVVYLTDTAATTWVVPVGVSLLTTVEGIGGGASGGFGASFGSSGGGGGGGYALKHNVAVTAGETLSIQVGLGSPAGNSAQVPPTATFLKRSGTTLMQANAGLLPFPGSELTGGLGGTGGVGDTLHDGGAGGNGADTATGFSHGGGGGGGGAGGPNGNGASGGNATGLDPNGGGAGGGGNGGGAAGANGGATAGAGGAAHDGTAGGVGGTSGAFPTSGSHGSGGGGGFSASAFGGGGAGGNGNDWDTTHGSGGGSGGSGYNNSGAPPIGIGGLYGGGGGGKGGFMPYGGGGGQGVIRIVYSTAVTTDTSLAMDNVVCTSAVTQLSQNLVSLRWSDDRGHSFGSPVSQSIGEVGEYRTSLQWQRLAYARDRVFEISWSVPSRTALQGAWIDVTPAQS